MVQLPGGGEAPLVTGNELVVPANTAVRVNLRTIDVIHSFWIPKLAGKVDMMPNRANHLWFKADKPGYYYGQCAEYCGESHAIMKFRVIALSPSEYAKWLENQKQAARTVTAQSLAAEDATPRAQFASMKDTGPGATFAGSTEFDADPFAAWNAMQKPGAGESASLIDTGRKLFKEKSCVNCHTVRGHEGGGVTAPDLTHIGSRSSIAAGVLENTPERLHQWLKDPEYFKPGNKMYHGVGAMAGYLKLDDKNRPLKDDKGEYIRNITLTDAEIDALVAYLHSLK
jgi:cytochrome c oxidase subunit 2